MKIEIQVTNESGATARLFATLADNSSAQAFAEKLRENPIALDMTDYSNFEKYGTLPFKSSRTTRKSTRNAATLC